MVNTSKPSNNTLASRPGGPTMVIACIVSFLAGAAFMVILAAVLLWYVFARLTRRRVPPTGRCFSMDADAQLPSRVFIEGDMWVTTCSHIQLENAVKNVQSYKLSKERKPKKEVEELSVTMKRARLENRVLLLTATDGTCVTIRLEGSTVMAVSSTMSATRKWAKKYPLKVEHTDRSFPEPILLLYFRTGWDKESWCEALRAAARKEVFSAEDGYGKLKSEFRDYLSQLRDNCPDIFKIGSGTGKGPGKFLGATKKSVSWKRILKKRSKAAAGDSSKSVGAVPTPAPAPAPAEEIGPSRNNSANGDEIENTRWESDNNHSSDQGPESSKKAEASTFLQDALLAKRFDGNTAALNVLVSRLFFDLYHSSAFIGSVQRRLQNTLSRIPTLSYISPITCSGIDIGRSPPIVQGVRALPVVDDVWGVELDITYTGGATFTLETRLDLRESRAAEHKLEASSAGAATADIINKSIQTVEDDLERANDTSTVDQCVGVPKAASGSSKKRWPQWKAILSSVADQVSQVPLVLSMRVVSLRGTLQFRIKAAPSDRIWYGFSSMPELELLPEPSFGEHKITTGPLLAYIAERIQVLISETVVHPNCEDIYVPWMMSDGDDWLQESCVPLPQVLTDAKVVEKSKNDNNRPQNGRGSSEVEGGLPELKVPLLDKHEDDGSDAETAKRLVDDPALLSSSSRVVETESQKKKSKREKMFSFGKKVEEKTRSFAEKMRERFEKD